jgi:hypothetical protein
VKEGDRGTDLSPRLLECLGGKRFGGIEPPAIHHPSDLSLSPSTESSCCSSISRLAHHSSLFARFLHLRALQQRHPSSDAYSACFSPLHPSPRSPTFPKTSTVPCLLPTSPIRKHRLTNRYAVLVACIRRRHRHVANWRRASCQAKRLTGLIEAQAWTH